MWPLSSADKKNTFFGGAAILTVGVILVKLIGAIYKIPLGNILSDEAYSDFTSAYNIYNLFLTISTAGLPVALSKTVSEADTLGRRNQIQRTFRVALLTFTVLGTLSFIAMSVFAQPLATASGNEAAVYCIMGLSPSVFCVCVMSAFRGYAQGHSNMIPTTVSQIIEAFFKMVAGLILAVLILRFATGTEEFRQQMAAAGAIVGVSIGSVVALVYLVFSYLRHRRRQRPSQDVPESSRDIFIHLLRLAIPITLGSAAMNLVTLIDTKVVLELLQKMYHDLPELITPEAVTQAETTAGVSAELFMARGLKGIYDKCMAVYNLPAALMVPLTASVIPAVSAALTRRDRLGAGRISESALRMGTLIALPAGVGLYVLAGPIVHLLYPELDLEIASFLMAVLGLASICVCIMLICNSILQAHGFVNLPIVTVVVGGVIKVAVNYLLVGNHEINIKGAPIGTLCCFGVVALMDLFIIKRVIPSPPSYIKVFFKPLIASVLMGGAAWACYGLLTGVLKMGNSLATLGSIAVAAVIYLILVVALRVISREDLALMPKGEKIAKILGIR